MLWFDIILEKQWFGPFQGHRGQTRASGQKVQFRVFLFSQVYLF